MLIVVIIHSNKRAHVETNAYKHILVHTLHNVMFMLFPYTTKVDGISKWKHEQTR